MDRYSYMAVMVVLKAMLKQQKISYAQLSAAVRIPEATIKKWMRAPDGAFSRVTLICDFLGVPLSEVLKRIENENVVTFEMNQRQQEFFLGDDRAFAIYWLLVYERRSEAQIGRQLQITPLDLRRTLLRLARLGLIEIGTKDKLYIPKTQPVRWSPKGDFMQKIFREWSQGVTSSALASKNGQDLILQFFQLSSESERELREDLLRIEEKYARLSIRDMTGIGTEIHHLRFLAAVAPGSFV